ncbi:NUDIX domain-containing protein [Patescibacteria group bacterium]|nr:NUDIX domain-containing protein [Patescibacteria group bacterium]
MSKKNRYLIAKNWPFVVVGCLVVKGDKVLLVKEASVEVGKWNQPAGWLEKQENPVLGAKREAEEETGFKIKITKFLGIYSLDRRKIRERSGTKLIDRHPVKLLFLARVVGRGKRPNPLEILEVKWFSSKEIKNLHKQKILRDPDIINEVQDYLAGRTYNLKLVHHLKV